jgi:hypothetical protein
VTPSSAGQDSVGLVSLIQDAPASPGVYFFLGRSGELLYVGKARNIRKRLQQHSQVKPLQSGWMNPRYELVSQVRWEVTDDEDSASAREADLIVALRPAYNAHVDEGRWAYIALERTSDRIRFNLSSQQGKRSQRTYGCFPHLGKGVSLFPGIACSDGYTALLRLLWAASGDGSHVPSRLSRSAPVTFAVNVEAKHLASLDRFLKGREVSLLDELRADWVKRDAYMLPALHKDHEAAGRFFRYGPAALRRLRLRHHMGAGPISRPQIEGMLRTELESLLMPGRPASVVS